MKWELTLSQHEALLNVITTFVLSMKSMTNLPPTYLLYWEIMVEAKDNIEINLIKLRAKNKGSGRFRLSRIQSMTFWIIMSEATEIAKREELQSLEFIMSTEICRDIHQKLLT